MENTLENKAKFFAQYWGQNVMCFNDEGQYKKGDCYEVQGDLDEYNFLELKPLSSITDEDAIQLAEFVGYKRAMKFDMRKKAKMILLAKEYLEKYLPITSVGDYLRSKGYALPYMGLSVEKQIEYGWIKLT